MNYFLICLLTLSLLSCDTKESDEIKDQTEIYGHYKIHNEKGSDKVKGSVIFYEKSSQTFKDHVALRGNSYVSYEGNRMQEVVDFGATTYKNNVSLGRTIQSTDRFKFVYENNDGKVYTNTLPSPMIVKIKPETIQVTYINNSTLINFDWDYKEISKCIGQKCSGNHVRVYLNINGTDSVRLIDVRHKPARIKIQDTTDYIQELSLCSSITQNASGAGTSNKKTSSYCDEIHSI